MYYPNLMILFGGSELKIMLEKEKMAANVHNNNGSYQKAVFHTVIAI